MRIYRIPKFVQRIFPNILWSFPDKKNGIFLTFDDGPHDIFTPQILNILEEYQVKATFFLPGAHIKGNEKIVQRIYESGHCIGVHGYEHISLLSKSKREIREQILRAQEKIQSLTGEPVKFFRPPYGRFSPAVIKACHSLSTQMVMWSFMSYDFDARMNDGRLVEIFQKNIRGGDIVVLHDGHENSGRTVRILREMIRICQSRNFELGEISPF